MTKHKETDLIHEGTKPTAPRVKVVHPAPTNTPAIVEFENEEYAKQAKLLQQAQQVQFKSTSYSSTMTIRDSFAIQMLASLVNASRANGTLPNADMMSKEAVKYADALIKVLSTKEQT